MWFTKICRLNHVENCVFLVSGGKENYLADGFGFFAATICVHDALALAMGAAVTVAVAVVGVVDTVIVLVVPQTTCWMC